MTSMISRRWVSLSILLACLFTVCATAQAEDFATRMMRATYKLYNKDSTATGFFVTLPPKGEQTTPKVALVTAKHAFQKMSGETALIVLRKSHADGTYERRDFAVAVKKDGKPTWTEHPQDDVAALFVELPADAEVVPLAFEQLATEEAFKQSGVHLTSQLFVLGYPTRFEANSAGFPVARHATVASFPLTPVKSQKTFLLDFATFSGDSGAPVFLSSDKGEKKAEDAPPLVVGMVIAQFRNDEEVKTLYGEQKLHHPLFLANTLHAQLVRETLELLNK